MGIEENDDMQLAAYWIFENVLSTKQRKEVIYGKVKEQIFNLKINEEVLGRLLKELKLDEDIEGEIWYLFNNDYKSYGYDNIYSRNKGIVEILNEKASKL